jgi:hypothetical protein
VIYDHKQDSIQAGGQIWTICDDATQDSSVKRFLSEEIF